MEETPIELNSVLKHVSLLPYESVSTPFSWKHRNQAVCGLAILERHKSQFHSGLSVRLSMSQMLSDLKNCKVVFKFQDRIQRVFLAC